MTQTARLYGDSLYELTVEEKITETVLEQMQIIRKLFQDNPEYLRLLMEPSISKEERNRLLDEAFGSCVEQYLLNFLKLLCERKILTEFSGCCEEFIRRYHLEHQMVEAVVTSAVELSKTQQENLQKKLEAISKKKVSMEIKVDASVIAGLRVELDGKQLDGTIQGRLSGVSKVLNEVIV